MHVYAGMEFEKRILANEKNNVKFNFLVPHDPYHAYYKLRVSGTGRPIAWHRLLPAGRQACVIRASAARASCMQSHTHLDSMYCTLPCCCSHIWCCSKRCMHMMGVMVEPCADVHDLRFVGWCHAERHMQGTHTPTGHRVYSVIVTSVYCTST